MPTLFITLFDTFLDTEINSLDIGKYSPPQLAKYLSNLLLRAREEFYNLAYHNPDSILNKMDDVVEFYSQEYIYSYNGTTFIQVLNPLPEIGSSFYVTVNDIETIDFSYNSSIGEITINNMPDQINNIDIIAFKEGQFNQTLTLIERGILIDWLGVIFQKDKIKEQKLYNQAIYGKDEGLGSQANQLRALQAGYATDRKLVTDKTLEYTFRNNPNKLRDMGGRSGIRNI